MSDLATDLSAILKTIRRPGDFCASGLADLFPPGIEIEGFGPLALPVLSDQAARLIAAATPAPFGRGQDTIIDKSIRRSWQIAPERVRITGKRWAATLETIVTRAALGLGVAERVVAEFYKLLVYEAGDFFVDHRDTEKTPGMFATLVIALPSVSTGGELVVRHAGREVAITLQSADPAEAAFAAFYADCVHEVRPIETGCRVTLVYNLIRAGRGKAPRPPRYDEETRQLAALLEAWNIAAVHEDAREGVSPPAKLVYPLEHAYTPADLSFAALKGADAAAAGVLTDAAARASCDLHLALLTVEESGSAEYTGSSRSGRGRWSEPKAEDFEIIDLFDRSEMLSEWRGVDGAVLGLGDMPVNADEYSPPGAVEDMKPDEQHFHEATGNEGASLERTYRRADLVLWPKSAFLPMIAAAGSSVALPYLGDLAARYRHADAEERTRVAREVEVLAGAMIDSWPTERRYQRQDETTAATVFLDHLVAVEARGPIERFLRRRDAGEGRGKADNRAIIAAMSLLAPDIRVTIVAHLIDDAGLLCFAACADLLGRAAAAWPEPDALRRAAARLLAVCPRDGMPDRGYPNMRLDDTTVADLVRGLLLIAPDLAEAAVQHCLASPKTFGLDSRLVPALRQLIADPGLGTTGALGALRATCVAHLSARVARPLAPPADLRRDNQLTCACADCAPVAVFLADPKTATWARKAAEQTRRHVEETIRNSHVDARTATDRSGRPHRLVVTKTQASYERLAKQRREDLAILAEIDAAP